jgi:hypothetical protein
MLKFNTGFEKSNWWRMLCVLSLAIGSVNHSVVAQEAGPKTETNQEKPKEQPKVSIDDVRKLLKELDGKSLKDRDAAEKSLIELGSAIVGFLPEVDANTSGEMKVRLQRIRQQLQTVEIVTYFESSKLTLAGKMSLTEAIESITKQTGNKIVLEGEDAFESLEVELNETDSSFWSVMDKVMAQTKLRLNSFAASDGVSLVAAGQEATGEKPNSYSTGPFRIEVASIQSSLPFNSRLGGQLDLSLTVSWEPRLKPVFMDIPMASLQATSDDEKALTSSSPESAPQVPLNTGGCSTQIDLQLQRPQRAATKLSKLSGEFVFAVPSEKHKYIFKKFGNGARQSEKFGETTVTLEGARRNGKVFEMRMLIEFGNDQGALDSFRGWILSNEAYLLDPKERRLENVGLQTYAVNSNGVGIAYLFQINGNPDEFQMVYESPSSITRQTVKYELQHIELP